MRPGVARLCISCLILALPLGASTQDPRLRYFNGPGFIFHFIEPEGWILGNEANQLSHFVMHERGTTWRQADPLIYIRLVRREGDLDLQGYWKQSLESFRETCPLYEVTDMDLELEGPHEFLVKGYVCGGNRREIIALTEAPRFFLVFVMSHRSNFTQKLGLPIFTEVLSSFGWQPKNPTLDNSK